VISEKAITDPAIFAFLSFFYWSNVSSARRMPNKK
jgi:hypothetical protein